MGYPCYLATLGGHAGLWAQFLSALVTQRDPWQDCVCVGWGWGRVQNRSCRNPAAREGFLEEGSWRLCQSLPTHPGQALLAPS